MPTYELVETWLLQEVTAAFGECHPAIQAHLSRTLTTDYGTMLRIVGDEPAWKLQGKCPRCLAPAWSVGFNDYNGLEAQLRQFTPSDLHMQAVWHAPLAEVTDAPQTPD